jgi:hypothetical protein
MPSTVRYLFKTVGASVQDPDLDMQDPKLLVIPDPEPDPLVRGTVKVGNYVNDVPSNHLIPS